MIEKIHPLISDIPEQLLTAARNKKLVPFIGAGVSQLSGCPGWSAFADASLAFFVDKGKLSYAELNQISSLSSRVKLSVALDLQRRHSLPIDFNSILATQSGKEITGARAYANLSKMASVFVTTNYDNLLEARSERIFKKNEISVEKLELDNAVIHIHGSIKEPSEMVLTTRDYLERYASHQIDGDNRENPFLTFLQILFKTRSVLFVGYGLGELEILEYVFQKGVDKPKENEEPRHFVLQGFFSHELELAKNLDLYYQSFGVKLLPYSRDENDWAQLVHVLESLVLALPKGRNLMSPKIAEMKDFL